MPAGVAARLGMWVGGRGGAVGSSREVVFLGLGRLGGYSGGGGSSSSGNRRRSRARDRDRRGGTVVGAAGLGRWWRWRLLWTGCEMEMKGLLDGRGRGRGRGSWGRVEGVVDQGRGALEPGEIAAIIWGR